MTVLRGIAVGRADLLAEVAGVLEGASEGEFGELLARQAAQLRRKARADPDQIPAWIETGGSVPLLPGRRRSRAACVAG